MGTYVEYAVGIGFFVKDTMRHVGSDVWYFVADDIDKLEGLVDEYAKKVCDEHEGLIEYTYEPISMRAVDQATWEPHGEEIQL